MTFQENVFLYQEIICQKRKWSVDRMKRRFLAGLMTVALFVSSICPAEVVAAGEREAVQEEMSFGTEELQSGDIPEQESSMKNAEADENGFVIDENGVLTEYTGEGGDVTVPGNVTSIGDYVFRECSSLTSITIPNSVTSIGDYAFWECSSLTSMTIPDSVTSIGDSAFEGCSSLTGITIPDSVTNIGDSAFVECSSLQAIEVETENTTYSSENGILYDKNKRNIIQCPGGKIGEVVLADSVTRIGDSAFDGCSSLTSITISDSVTLIGDFAFAGCSSLTSITIPDSVTSIGICAFAGCSSLTNITIPDSVTITSIGIYAFWGCSSLTGITIPDSVISIEDYAFKGCSSLTSITISDSVTNIGNGAFDGCSSLTSITIPDSVTSIGLGAFWGCASLISIIIPDSVTSIGSSAFDYCNEYFVIICLKDSYAEKYAKEHNIRYQYLGTTPETSEKKVQTITAYDITKAFGDAAFSLNATTDGNGTLTYVSDNTAVATVDSNGTVTLAGAGTAHIKITASETDTYQLAEKTITITVNPAETPSKTPEEKEQTITAKDITKTYGEKAFSLNVKTNGGGKLTYKVLNTKIATVDKKGKVTLKGCGKTQIKITAAAAGNYKKATKTITLTVKPKKAAVTSVKSQKSGTLTVKWKQDKKAKGYIIQYSTDKKFKKSVKTITISKNKTTSKTITKLKGGKKYYVRVCAYTTSDGKTIKGSYSNVMNVKVKK